MLYKEKFYRYSYYYNFKLVFLIAFLLAFYLPVSKADLEQDKIQWIELLRTLENDTNILEYKVECRTFNANPEKGIISPQPTGVILKYHIVKENKTGCYLVESDRLIESDKKDLTIFYRKDAFDGEIPMAILRQAREKQYGSTEKYNPPRGKIGGNDKIPHIGNGLNAFLPFYQEEGLSSLVEKAAEVKFIEKPGNILEVHYLNERREEQNLSDWTKCTLDLNKGGAIKQIKLYHMLDGDPKEYHYLENNLEYDKTDDGSWVPTSSTEILGGTSKKHIRKYKYWDVKKNHMKVDKKFFSIQFPVGTPVIDYLTGDSYWVGMKPKELESIIEETLVQINSDETGALDAPAFELMSEESENQASQDIDGKIDNRDNETGTVVKQIPENDNSPKNEWENFGDWVASFLFQYSFSVLFIKKKKTNNSLPLLVLLVLSVVCQSGYSEDTNLKKTEAYKHWEVPIAGDQKVSVWQCGLYVTAFTLKYFKQEYSLDELKNAMEPDTNGISFLNVKKTLMGYGLNVSARQGIKAEYLKEIFFGNNLVIMPIKISKERGHYMIILPINKNERKQYYLVDIGKKTKKKSIKEINEFLASEKGTVLIVSKPKKSDISRFLEVKPEIVDFGILRNSNTEKVRKSITLKNISDSPIMIEEALISCSCSTTKFEGGLLEAKQSREVPIFVYPSKWGLGEQTKKITFLLGDGSRKVVAIKGNGLIPEHLQGLQATPTELNYKLDFGYSNDDCVKKVSVSNLGSKVHSPFNLDTSKSDSWLDVSIETNSDGPKPGIISIKVKPELITASEAHSEFAIYKNKAEDPVVIPVHVFKQKPYSFSSRLIILQPSKNKTSSIIEIKPRNINCSPVKVKEVSSDNENLGFDIENSDNGSSTVTVKAGNKELEKGLFKIKFEILACKENKISDNINIMVLE